MHTVDSDGLQGPERRRNRLASQRGRYGAHGPSRRLFSVSYRSQHPTGSTCEGTGVEFVWVFQELAFERIFLKLLLKIF